MYKQQYKQEHWVVMHAEDIKVLTMTSNMTHSLW